MIDPRDYTHCPLCASEVWNNRAEKATGARYKTTPDSRCKVCYAAGWLQPDGSWKWLPSRGLHLTSRSR